MENSGKTLKYLTIHDVLRVAEEQVGRSQLLNENQLHYLVQIVGEKIGDTELFPTLAQKAAVYAHHIITRHTFLDGNKRTGMHCALLFFELNGFFHPDGIDDSIVELGLNIADGTINDIEGNCLVHYSQWRKSPRETRGLQKNYNLNGLGSG